MDKLLFLDIYGLEPKLFFNKQAKYRSYVGLLATLVTLCLTGLFAFLFGTDFFYRANPIVISQEKILEKSPVVYPTSETYPVFFSTLIKNKPVTNVDDFVLSYYFHYSYLNRDSEGKLSFIHDVTLRPKKCSETGSKNNPLMANYNLDELFCLDWEELAEIIGEPPRIGGVFDENEFAIYRLTIDNCERDFPKYECKDYLSFEKAFKHISEAEIIVALYQPSFYVDVDSLSNPLIQNFEVKPYNIAPSVGTLERKTFELSKFEDDIGWIFKDVQIYEAIQENKVEVETEINFEREGDHRTRFYTVINYLGKKTSITRRRFMKIQELMAMVGGFLKLIVTAFQILVKFVGRFRMNLIYFQKANIKCFKEKVLRNNLTVQSNVSIAIDKQRRFNLTFWEYFLSFMQCKKHSKIIKYDSMVKELSERLDIIRLLEVHDVIQKLEIDLKKQKDEET